MKIYQKERIFFFFTHAITILSLFTYSVCDGKVKMTLEQVVTNFTGQVVASCACVCARARASMCYNTTVVYTIHHRKLCTCMFRLKEIFFIIFSTDKNFLQNVVLSYIAAH